MASRRRIETNLQRPLPKPGERTGRHKCTLCLREIPVEELLRNDFVCDVCAEKEEPSGEGMRDEG